MTGLDSLVSDFRARVQSIGEINLCFISATDEGIAISAPVEFVAEALWENRNTLKKAAIQSGIVGVIDILYEGRNHTPPIDLRH